MKKSELKNYIREEIISTLSENIEDDIKALDAYDAKLDDVIKKKQEAGIEEGKDHWADYTDIGQSYLEGFGKKHSLTQDQLEKLGKKIVDQLYKGDVAKAYDAIVKRDLKEDDDKEPSDAEIKKNKSLAKAAEELAVLTREMKSLTKKYSKAEGQEKEDLLNKLKSKTKLKKELDKILDK